MKQNFSAILLLTFSLFTSLNNAKAEEEITLTLSHFLSPKSETHTKFLAPWAKNIEEASNGRIKIEIFPAMSLGGKPPELYRQLRDGVADMVWTVTGYTPGVFPRSEVFELPTVHEGSARTTNLAIWDNFDLVAEDFSDIKPLLVHVHAGQALHMVEGCIESVEGLKGKKLRTPSRTGGWMIEAWGGEPVGMPVPALPQALAKGVVDGAMIPYQIVTPLKIHEFTQCSISGAEDARFGTAVFLFAMNKARYNALPDDLKAIIDANSGVAIAENVGVLWDSIEAGGRDAQRQSGAPVIMLDKASTDEFNRLNQTVVDRWIKTVEARGIDGEKLVSQARSAIKKYTP